MKENLLLLKDLLELWKTRYLAHGSYFNVYFDILDDIVKKYNNTVHRTINMKPIDVTPDSYAEYNEDSNEKDPKFKFSHCVRISKYKKYLLKIYTQNWSEEVFIISKIKNIFNSWIDKKWHYIKMIQYFPEPCRSFGGNINVKVDLSNYATKTDLKNITHIDTSSFALKQI